jgi:hypothetical protein
MYIVYLMRKTIAASAMMLALGGGVAYAQEPRKSAVSYGDYCESLYGFCKKEMTLKEAANALRHYFARRGYDVIVVAHLGRFMKADVYKDQQKIDSIILDRKTGKMRSIY